jgi:hypothetical protein
MTTHSMNSWTRRLTLGLALSAGGALLVLPGCARQTGEAGVKPIGVGFDPGDIFAAPEARGGVIDFTLARLKGHQLDLGITGFFGSGGAFVDPASDPFDSALGFGYLFSPALTAADEYGLISPKGPDVPGACFVQVNTRGPLGSFRTVDVGERMQLRNVIDPEIPLEERPPNTLFELSRNPQDYPINTTNVFLNYSGFDNYRQGDEFRDGNWAFGSDLALHFDGGLPPGGAPVASIPLSSDQEDPRVDKPAGDPVVWSADELTNVFVSNQEDGSDAELMRYAPLSGGLPSPLLNDGVLRVTWDAPANSPERANVTVSLKLLSDLGDGVPLDGGQSCVPVELFEPGDGVKDLSWQIAYNDVKKRWCDEDFEPDPTVGNVEGGDFFDENGIASTEDTCHNGIDEDGNGRCDEGGCFDANYVWLVPDPSCARHTYQTAYCATDGTCRATGGNRAGDGTLGELICTAEDTGDFTVPADEIDGLLARVDASTAVGAVLVVARTHDSLITVPMVRDPVGNQDDINPVRVRTSQVHYGRLAWDAPPAEVE